MNKINYKDLIVGCVLSLVILIAIAVTGYSIGSANNKIWPAVIVVQFGVAILWLIVKLGTFSNTGKFVKEIGKTHIERKNAKLGAYVDEDSKSKKQKQEVDKKNNKKSKDGIYIMLIIGVIEIISTLWLFI